MSMSNLIKSVSFAAISLIAPFAAFAGFPGQASKTGSKDAGSGTVQSITLPQVPADIPAGPHVDTYRKDCLICHSGRYVTMQPRFPEAVWEKEVKKMIDAYGAVIPEADQKEIVEYLVAVRGPQESK